MVLVAREIFDSFKYISDRKHIHLDFYSSIIKFHTVFDKDKVERILINLLSNAIKFSPSNKNVTVIAVDLGNAIEISIEDEGPGINAEDQLKLYQKFQKLTAKPTGGESSTGLGLSIVKTMVEKMKGKIHYQSEDGKGAKFVVNLPK